MNAKAKKLILGTFFQQFAKIKKVKNLHKIGVFVLFVSFDSQKQADSDL